MIKIMEEDIIKKSTISMKNMRPLAVGIIVDEKSNRKGHYVLRTSCTSSLEIMDLSEPGEDCCWTEPEEIEVELLSEFDTLVIGLSNRNSNQKTKRGCYV